MKKILLAFMLCSLSLLADANSTVEITEKLGKVETIYHNYDAALERAKEEKKSLFILFQREHCPWCKKLRETTLQDDNLTQQLNDEYVVLLLDRDKTYTYPKRYKVIGVPVVYLVDRDEKVEVIEQGYNEDPKYYIELLNICTKRAGS